MQIKGIKRGKVIELLEEMEVPDDTEILIEVREISPMSVRERWEKMKAFLESDVASATRGANAPTEKNW